MQIKAVKCVITYFDKFCEEEKQEFNGKNKRET